MNTCDTPAHINHVPPPAVSTSQVIIGETIQFRDWQEHWEATKRCYEALVAEQRTEYAYEFFSHCMMLKNALKRSPQFQRKKVNTLFTIHWEMRLCREIHERRTRFMAAPAFLGLYFMHVADRCMDRWSYFLKIALEKNRNVA